MCDLDDIDVDDDYDDRDEQLIFSAPPAPREIHEGIAIIGWFYGQPVPDLDKLPQERRLAALRPLTHRARRRAVASVSTPAEANVVLAMLGELMLEDDATVARAVDAPPPPMPAAALPTSAAGRQINFRLGPAEHARLREAAKLFAMRPTTLARILTIRGVDRALYEERRDR